MALEICEWLVSLSKRVSVSFLNGAACILLSLAISIFLYLRRPDSLSGIPGPPIATYTRLYSAFAIWSGKEHELLQAAHKKYGPIIRWQPNLVLISDPECLPQIYHHKANKTPHYNGSVSGVEGIVEVKDWEKHRDFKKRIAFPFSLTAGRMDEEKIDDLISKWLDKLETEFAKKHTIFDFTHLPFYMFQDINSMRFFGKPFGFIEKGHDMYSILKVLYEGAYIVQVLARLPRLKKFFFEGLLGSWLVPKRGDGSAFGDLLEAVHGRIDARISERTVGEPQDDGLNYFLHQARNSDGSHMTIDEVKEDTLFLILAGSETLSHTLRSTIAHIATNPIIYHKVESEILAGFKAESRAQTLHTENLPYLSACVRESTRFDPAVVSYLPRYAKTGGLSLLDHFIPEGTELGSSAFVINRDKKTFGVDAGIFRPERYLDPVWAKWAEKREFGFGYGRRKCLAKDLALFLVLKSVYEFFKRFEIEVVNEGEREAAMFWIVKGMKVKLKCRDQDVGNASEKV